MNCPNCKHKFDRPYLQCPNCKANIKLEDIRLTQLENKLLSAFRDKLFLAIPILTTVSAVLSLIDKGLPVFSILFSIFLWITYSNAKKGFVTRKNLRAISGTIFAEYLGNIIWAISMTILGFVTIILFSLTSMDTATLIEAINEKFNLQSGMISHIPNLFLKNPLFFIIMAFLLRTAYILITNLLWRHKIHNFTQSVYKNLENDIESPEITLKARNSLFILSSVIITESIIIYSGILHILTSLTLCVAGILSAILINKYFINGTKK
jgi:hypothetical protein